MNGIQYLNGPTGKPNRVVIDLQMYGREVAAFLQQLAQKYENQQNNNSLSPFGNGGNPTPAPTPTPNNNTISGQVDQLLRTARSYIGTPYRTGGTTTSGMDCSGLTSVVYQAIGVALPRVSRDQANAGAPVNKSDLRAGDLLYFATSTPGRVNHVGLVSEVLPSGEVRFIHASSSRGVMEASMSLDYWQQAYMGARRVI